MNLVDCICKGKAHKKYELGCKVSFVITQKEAVVLSSQALHGNPYNGHMKSDGKLKRNFLHKIIGNKLKAVLVGIGTICIYLDDF